MHFSYSLMCTISNMHRLSLVARKGRVYTGMQPLVDKSLATLKSTVNFCISDFVLWKKKKMKFADCRLHLRKQPTFGNAITGFPAKWHLRNEQRNSILMMCHYPDLGGASDWSCCQGIYFHILGTLIKVWLLTWPLTGNWQQLTLQAPVYTYKFSKLISIHFLKEWVERIW